MVSVAVGDRQPRRQAVGPRPGIPGALPRYR
jgi:hypothetical protein